MNEDCASRIQRFEVDPGPSLATRVAMTLLELPLGDPFMYLVIGIEAFLALMIQLVRSHILPMTVVFLVMCAGIYVSEDLNTHLAENFDKYGIKENYFDSECIFVYTVWTLPLFLGCISIIISLTVDIIKSVAVHRYVNQIMPKGEKGK